MQPTAASIYARGWQDGVMAERQRDEGVRRRERAAARRIAEAEEADQ